MNRVVRRKLEMAVRVRDFSRAHPSTDASYATVLGRLDEGVARLESLSQQQQEGYAVARSAAAHRRALRRRLHYELVRHLVRVAEVAAGERPVLVERFRLPTGNESNEAFRTLARRMLEQGRAEQELLARHGLAAGLLDDLASALGEFDASVAASNEARREHVGARAELDRVSAEVMQLVELLDGLNRYRFGERGELRAAWESAKRVAGPRGGEEEDGEVKPAA